MTHVSFRDPSRWNVAAEKKAAEP